MWRPLQRCNSTSLAGCTRHRHQSLTQKNFPAGSNLTSSQRSHLHFAQRHSDRKMRHDFRKPAQCLHIRRRHLRSSTLRQQEHGGQLFRRHEAAEDLDAGLQVPGQAQHFTQEML
ncbi:hypothetical protein [Verrucomicrobium spinosum]|uniref:hypothetical protein n=1 Tax=Verrucomicrobium spinosum TaxID=2736 RepID=UPI0009E9FE7E|nr:hypothetical protein [Verrucomicrobium spinosum]